MKICTKYCNGNPNSTARYQDHTTQLVKTSPWEAGWVPHVQVQDTQRDPSRQRRKEENIMISAYTEKADKIQHPSSQR